MSWHVVMTIIITITTHATIIITRDGEACDHIVDARQLAGPFSWRKVMAVVFSVGIRPCTGAILVLVFALTQGLFWAGVAATFAMALGTAITVAALATLALGSRELALKLGGANAAWANTVWTACAIGGGGRHLPVRAVVVYRLTGPGKAVLTGLSDGQALLAPGMMPANSVL